MVAGFVIVVAVAIVVTIVIAVAVAECGRMQFGWESAVAADPVERVQAWHGMVFQQGEDELFGWAVLVLVVVVVVTVMAMVSITIAAVVMVPIMVVIPVMAVVSIMVVVSIVIMIVVVAVVPMVAGDMLKRVVGRHKDGVVVARVLEQRLNLVMLVDQLGELGRVLALLDQLVDGLVWIAVVLVVMVAMATVPKVRPVDALVFLTAVLVGQGENAVESRALEALGYLVLDGREEAGCVWQAIPPLLDRILSRDLIVIVEEASLIFVGDRGTANGSSSCE